MKTWQLQQAKARFSEMFTAALAHGPQFITRRGKDTAVLISLTEFDALRASKQPSFVDFMRKSPLMGLQLNVERNSQTRPVDIEE